MLFINQKVLVTYAMFISFEQLVTGWQDGPVEGNVGRYKDGAYSDSS